MDFRELAGPLGLTLQLAAWTTGLLLLLGTPLAWWLARTRSRLRPLVEAVTALPLVLPPTVLGFYVLVLARPDAPLGAAWVAVTGDTLTFSFEGLVFASLIYSLPFTVQPLQRAFGAVDESVLEAAAGLGAGPWSRFREVVLPRARGGFTGAAVLTFAHTMGEFGVVLMVGGNLPGETRVIAIAIYEHVETLDFAAAHAASALLLGFALVTLLVVSALDRRGAVRVV